MNYLETNIKLLAQRFPGLAEEIQKVSCSENDYKVSAAKNGQRTLQANLHGKPIYLHSTYDPGKEAERALADKSFGDWDIVFVFGFGLGYQVQEIVRKTAGQKVHIFVIEKDPRVFRLALEHMDLTQILGFPHIHFFVDLPVKDIYREMLPQLRIDIAGQAAFFDHQPSIQLYKEYYTQVLEIVRDAVSVKLSTLATVLTFKGQWLKNSLENLTTIRNSAGVSTLDNKFRGVPAIIVSAGPSLDKNVSELHRAKGKAVIIGVGTSLRTLLKENILPDLVIAYDASELNYRHFRGMEYGMIPLVFEPMVYPQIVKDHGGTKFVFNTKQTQLNLSLNEISSKGHLDSGGSIATSAFSLALHMGCDPIILIGQDLAYSNDGRTHTGASVYGQDKVEVDNPLHFFEVPGYFGKPVSTSRSFYTFLKWFENKIEQIEDRHIINATEGGAMIKGTAQVPLAEAIEKYCQASIDVGEVLTEIAGRFRPDDVTKLAGQISEVTDSLRRLSKDAGDAGELCGGLHRMYSQKRYVRNKVKKTMAKMDALDSAIKSNPAAGLLTEMLQDLLLASERGTLVREEETDDDFTRAAKRSDGLQMYYKGVHEAAEEVITWLQDALSQLRPWNNGMTVNEGEGKYVGL